MKIYKNNFGILYEVKSLSANMMKGLKNKKIWVAGPLAREFIAYTPTNYKTLCRVTEHSGRTPRTVRSFTIIVNDTAVFLEGSASNQYTLRFDTFKECQKWTRNIVKTIGNCKL